MHGCTHNSHGGALRAANVALVRAHIQLCSSCSRPSAARTVPPCMRSERIELRQSPEAHSVIMLLSFKRAHEARQKRASLAMPLAALRPRARESALRAAGTSFPNGTHRAAALCKVQAHHIIIIMRTNDRKASARSNRVEGNLNLFDIGIYLVFFWLNPAGRQSSVSSQVFFWAS